MHLILSYSLLKGCDILIFLQRSTLGSPQHKLINLLPYYDHSGFGGLGVVCWPLVPKFAGSNPAEAVGFLGRKNSQHAFHRRGSKAVGPMS